VIFSTVRIELDILCDHVDGDRLMGGTIFDPFAGTGAITKYFMQRGAPRVFSNDIAPQCPVHYRYDAINRFNWTCMGHFDYVVSSPPFEVLDLAVPI